MEGTMKNMKLGTKMIISFAAVALITLLLGIVGYYGATQSVKAIEEIGVVRLPSVESLLVIKDSAQDIRAVLRTLVIPGIPLEDRRRQSNNLAKARERYEKAWKIYEPLPQTLEEAELWKRFVPAWNAWQEENNKFLELSKQIDHLGITDPMGLGRQLEQFTKDHYILMQRVLQLLQVKDAMFKGGEDHSACNAGKWLPTFKTSNDRLAKEVQTIIEPHQRFHEGVRKIKELLGGGNREEAQATYERQMVPAMQEVFQHFDAMRKIADDSIEQFNQAQNLVLGPVRQRQLAVMELLDKIIQINSDVAAAEVKQSNAQAGFLKGLSLVATLLGVVLALALGVLITRSITKPINRIIESLSEGADQVSSASGQVSSASQQLAEGSSQQAASLEETSSSLEEMSSMTKQNADNANQANALINETSRVVEQANHSMTELTQAMRDISDASTETAKIIKTIDEIAFQTNLLALNAAVEAARAGEAGAGFAVVADEVRNLAMRAAEAAKNTANLIEGTVIKVKGGAELVSKTAEAFTLVATSTNRSKELVAEIAAASNEQAQGVDQISKAVSEMDKVVQQNAANAEESASASEELSAQAEQMLGVVGELVAVVEGNGTRAKTCSPRHLEVPPERRMAQHQAIPTLKLMPKPGNGRPAGKKAFPLRPTPVSARDLTRAQVVSPNQVIPLDEGEFKNF
jgi:methyl-accepting chemotaxis protein